MLDLHIDASDLLKWAEYTAGSSAERDRDTRLAGALNTVGHDVAQQAVREIADKTGLEAGAIAKLVLVKDATPDNLVWEGDFSSAIPPNATDWVRPWDRPNNDKAFDEDTLVNILILDEDACEQCKKAAEEGPYTMGEIQTMAAKWKDYVPQGQLLLPGVRTNLVHPRCRCVTGPYSSLRRLPVAFATGGEVRLDTAELLNTRQIGKLVADEMMASISTRR